MFFKAVLTFLAVGAISVNAMTIPVARSPAPEPESAQELEAWMLKRDLSYDLFSRELQALDELFSREPEDWAQWAKREPRRPSLVPPPPPPPATPPPPAPDIGNPPPPTINPDKFNPAPIPRPGTPTPLTRVMTGGTGRPHPVDGHRVWN